MVGHAGVKPCSVYGLVDPRDGVVRYVGKTAKDDGGRTRLTGHLSRVRLGRITTHRDAWIKSLLDADLSPAVKVLEAGEWTALQLDDRERWWIAHFAGQLPTLTNHTVGGDGGSHDSVTRGKIGAKARGRKMPDGFGAAVTARMLGHWVSDETRLKISEANKQHYAAHPERAQATSDRCRGVPKSEETKLKLSAKIKGRPLSAEHAARAAATAKTMVSVRWARARAEGRARPEFTEVECANPDCAVVFTVRLESRKTCSQACRYALISYTRKARHANSSG